MGVLGASALAFVITQSLMAVGVVLTLFGIAFYILELFQMKSLPLQLDVVPTGAEDILKKFQLPYLPGGLREVFYIAGDRYTYDEAPAVCAAYNADLASYDQVADAYAKGAEWCGYGWTVGGMALFPTQETSWKRYQQEHDIHKRTRCGRPGINGGYFDPKMKFGVNCFGVKPSCNNKKYPIPIEGSGIDPSLVKKYREESPWIRVDPFNRFGWSMWGLLG